MAKQIEGIQLVRAVIKCVLSRGFIGTFGASMVSEEIAPRPVPAHVLASLTLDGGVPLTPSMREWLAFDGSFFEWFEEGDGYTLKQQKIGALAEHWLVERGAAFGSLERTLLKRDCYWVPFGDETMRFVYPSKLDAAGELPVMLLDADDMPALSVGYPGIDVYLGQHARLIDEDEAPWKARTAFHQKAVLRGKRVVEWGDRTFPEPSPEEHERGVARYMAEQEALPPGMSRMGGGHAMLEGDGPVPDGFRVVSEMANPFTGARTRLLAPVKVR